MTDADPAAPTMRAAVLHKVGQPLSIERVERPLPRPTDVLVEVKACGVVPNYFKVLEKLEDYPWVKRPTLPAIYGLDVCGVIAAKGSQVHGLEVGQRVYVNPLRVCGGCRPCRMGDPQSCRFAALAGYFGLTPDSQQMFDDYRHGGFAEFMVAPQSSIITLPDNVPFEAGARWGYLGTAFGALKIGKVGPSSVVLVNGVTGTLGLGAALFALALGARKILGLGRNRALLDRVKAIAPDRIAVMSMDDGSPADWARAETGGAGADVIVDALPTDAPHEALLAALGALAYGGRFVNAGGVSSVVPVHLMSHMNHNQDLLGSMWFTTPQGQEMADLAEAGLVRLDVLEHELFPLEQLAQGLPALQRDQGGFGNYVISPQISAPVSSAEWVPIA